MFKVGDVVTCVRATVYSAKLIKGTQYVITHVSDRGNVRVEGNESYWDFDRFEHVPKPVAEGVAQQNVVRLRVIEGMRPHLRVGDIVTVKKENEKSYLLNEHPGKLWAKRRFEIVVDAPAAPKKVAGGFNPGDRVFSDKAAHNGKFEAGEILIVKNFNGIFFDFEDPKKLGMERWKYNKDNLNVFGYNFQHYEEKAKAPRPKKEEKKQAVPPKPVIGCIYEEAAKQEKAGAIGKDLCSWVVQNKGEDKYHHQNWPCYAGLQRAAHAKVEQCLISMKNAKRYIHTVKEQEMYDDWLQYVVEESPFKSAFLTKTAEEAKEKGLLLDCSRSRVECLVSATAMRDGYEHSSRLPIFTHFIEEGYSKHTAYLLSYMLTENNGNWNISGMTNGHTNMDGSQDIQQIFKFFREGFHNASWKREPAWNSGNVGNGGMYVYIAESNNDNSMRKFVQSFGKKTGKGWQEYYTMDEKSVKKLADAIEANIVK